MLRKRSRAVTSKQANIVGDQNNHPWQPPEKPTKPSSFFFTSPRFLKGLFFTSSSSSSSSPRSSDIDSMMSPTSILDTNPFSAVANFWIVDNNKIYSNNKTLPKTTQPQHSWEQPNNKKGIGLALIDENSDVITNSSNIYTTAAAATSAATKQQKRKLVVFGSQLRIQVPPLSNSPVFPCFSPESPREFGIKTPRNNLWPFGNKDSHSHSQVHPVESPNHKGNGIVSSGNESLSMSEIEQSEDYTCVISHGPNPKTTHIFGNCIVESCCGKINGSSSSSSPSCFSAKRSGYMSPLGVNNSTTPSQQSFLSSCHNCNKKLGVGTDIYMYRGEKAFCSQECRCQEMLFDGVEN